MAKTYPGQTASGSHPPTEATKVTTPPASGPVKVLVDMGPTLGLQWNYSGAVNGTTTFYVVDNGPTLGKQRSAS
jgi:hypothetical protein